ncbi:site-2 protease family protein [Herbivorax sp. ANBcel31]|uniref:site-2 protease family protein n=1 Tax=Herbivorax sp. ANBcel31 TaxID=3069754 RepID=UPI0027B2BF2E|nr:site-2 protease family protein [Herbivorax sp. ANBcel31]MDQ2085749.1 site-2 protease family protein [Herbivorax sp. ANBcel31]
MFFTNLGLAGILYYFMIFAFSISFHESSHAYMAYRLGDNTGKDLGRVTLNPMKHLDLFGTVLLFFAGIGWAKPVPFNPSRFENRKFGTMMVSFAGPLSNIILAFIFAFIYLFIGYGFGVEPNFESTEPMVIASNFSSVGIMLNVLLAVFNLLPIPPLDGSKVFTVFLPEQYYFKFMQYQNITFIVLILLLATGILWDNILYPARDYMISFIYFILEPIVRLIT